MKKFRVGGTAYNINLQKLNCILTKKFVGIEINYRVYGIDFRYSEENFELYINSVDEIEYFISIYFFGHENILIQCLKDIVEILEQVTNIFELGYYEVDENGNQISVDYPFPRSPEC